MFKALHTYLFGGKTKNKYHIPLLPETPIQNVLYDWPSHKGPFEGAVDLAVPLGTPVLAPLHGTVVEVVDTHDEYGPSAEFSGYLNYITVKHDREEYSQLAHLLRGSVTVKAGEDVKAGQILAYTGLNGWMEEPYLEHLHMLVFRVQPGGFQGVRIRFVTKPTVTK